jgi:TetR/AcrR family transcriptional regulator
LTRGFVATTVEDLAAEADVAIGSLYGNFAGKDGLYVALIRRALDLDKHYCDKGWAAGDDPVSRMIGLADGYAQFCRDHPGYFRLFRVPITGAPSGAQATSEVARLVEGRTREEIARMSEALREAIDAQTIRDVDPERTARILWAMWDGVLALSLQDDAPAKAEMDRILAQTQQLLTAALLANPADVGQLRRLRGRGSSIGGPRLDSKRRPTDCETSRAEGETAGAE